MVATVNKTNRRRCRCDYFRFHGNSRCSAVCDTRSGETDNGDTCAKMIFYWMTQPMIDGEVSHCVHRASCKHVLLPNVHTMMTYLPSNEILVFFVLVVMLNV